MTGQYIDPEDVPGLIAEQERQAEAHRVDFENRVNEWTRFLVEGVSFDDLKGLHWILSLIANGENPQVLANFYEGQAAGILSARRIIKGEGIDPVESAGPSPHAFVGASAGFGDPGCKHRLPGGFVCDLPVFNRVHLL